MLPLRMPIRTLLISPVRLMDLVCGDDIITELLLAHPPEDVAYTHFGRGLEEGWLRRTHPAAAWTASLVMHSRPPAGVRYHWPGLPPLPYRLMGRLLPDRPDVDVQWLALDEPGRFDLIHAYTYPVHLDAKARKLPLVLSTGSGNTDLLRNYMGLTAEQVERLVRRDRALLGRLGVTHDLYQAREAKLVTVPSRYAIRLHVEAGVPEEKLRLVRIGFETPELPARAEDGTCRFTLVGHHFRRKGGHALLAAFDRLRRLHPEARLTIVSAVDDLGIDPSGIEVIRDLPRSAIYREIYPRTDVYVLPSLAEGYGMSVVEAMSFGLPVIASDISALPELVQDGVTGRLVPPGDAEALFVAMRELMEDPALRRRFGAAGREAFVREHAFEATNRALRAVYEEATGAL